jgi:Flp pilus assembly protein TadG
MRTPPRQGRRKRQAGQSVTEFALVVPVLLVLLIAISDFGRFYASAVAVEAAGREAADFGAFDAGNWTAANAPNTVVLMEERACVAAAGSHLEGYATTDPTNKTCTNPAMTCTLEVGGLSADCATSGGFVGASDCSAAATEPPCVVHVQMTYQFQTLLSIPPMPPSVGIVRDSRFVVSSLVAPGP